MIEDGYYYIKDGIILREDSYNGCAEVVGTVSEDWHDLRKNPNDLPIYETQFLCLIETMAAFVYETRPRLGYCTMTRGQIMNLKEFVIAWKKIEPFEVNNG